jgi:hypothetical protein
MRRFGQATKTFLRCQSRYFCLGRSASPGAERGRVQAAEETSAAAVGQYIQREYALSDAGRSQDDPFGILLWPFTLGGATGNLIPQGALEY